MSKNEKYAAEHAPIGVFDSGVGGLTVASGIEGLLPREALIYFGDTEHLPYGDKSTHAIRYYIKEIATFLAQSGCKLIVTACNSASSVLDNQLLSELPLPVIDVIDPVVEAVAGNPQLKKVGVIGTRLTIKSGVYGSKLRNMRPDIEVVERATPLLASMIEEGFHYGDVAHLVLSRYLEGMEELDALILGCTHYPLMKKTISAILGDKVQLIDAPEVVALKVKEKLTAMNQLNSTAPNPHEFFVSDLTENFEQMAQLFFGDTVKLQEHSLTEH